MKGKVGFPTYLLLTYLLTYLPTYFSFHGYRLTMVLNTEMSWSPNYYLYHRICLTINKIVYYQHLLVSFEELLSLRLSDHFALVVGCINNNWLNLWKKDACKVFTGISPPLSQLTSPFSQRRQTKLSLSLSLSLSLPPLRPPPGPSPAHIFFEMFAVQWLKLMVKTDAHA